jgi:signal transduction histidine kinase
MNEHASDADKKDRSTARSIDVWVRSNWVWSLVFVVGLLLGLALALPSGDLSRSEIAWAIALNLFLGLWHFFVMAYFQRTEDFREQPRFSIIYIAVLIGVWFILIRIHPGFYATQMILWSQIFMVLAIHWAAPFAVLIFAINFYQQTIDSGEPPNLLLAVLFLGVTVLVVFFGGWIGLIINQSVERKQLIEQLEAAQADLARSERAAGIAAERQRLAHEIHDTLAQGFISIIMHLEAAEGALPADAEASAKHLVQAREMSRESLDQARRVVNDLRPEVLESAPVHDAVERVTRGWAAQSGVAAGFTCTGDPIPLHPEIEVTLLRATQEALANVQKHAQAERVEVTLSYLDSIVILDVQDDGSGLTKNERGPASDLSGGFGLVAMRERVDQLGGELQIESEPGGGTTLAVSIPLTVISESADSGARQPE